MFEVPKPIVQMRRWQAPNVIVFSRAARPPIPSLEPLPSIEKPPTVEECLGTKQEVRGMSVQSSLNLSRLLSCLNWSKNGQCLHVSLSYNGHDWPKGKDALLKAKSLLVAHLNYHFPDLCGFWILEFQSRENPTEKKQRLSLGIRRIRGQGGSIKVPHWHLLVWIPVQDGIDFEARFRAWWARFSGNKSVHGCCITSGDQGRAAWYLAMHAAKRSQPPPFPCGRMWGYIGREKVLSAVDLHQTGDVENRERVWCSRLYRRSTGGKIRNEQGFSWFLPRASQCRLLQWVREHIEFERITRFRPTNPF